MIKLLAILILIINLIPLYTFWGYYYVLVILNVFGIKFRKFNKKSEKIKKEFTVAFIISVYNGEKIIENKIKNTLKLDYNWVKLKIYILSDGSTDKTIVKAKSFNSNRIVIYNFKIREGKTAVLNKVIPELNEDIIIFSDIDSIYNKNAIKELLKPFINPKVGFVTGVTKYKVSSDDSVGKTTSIYTEMEARIKNLESQLYSCINADGAIFAIRRILYKKLRLDDINDFVIPLYILKQKFVGVFNPNAITIENTSKNIGHEFRRQIRINTRTLRAIIRNIALLNFSKYKLVSFFFLSHKVLRYIVPFIIILNLVVSLIFLKYTIFYWFLMLQMFVYIFLFLNTLLFKIKLFNFISDFFIMNFAILISWIELFKGNKYIIWNKNGI